jgi:Ca2+-binding RTX toxin-like protein
MVELGTLGGTSSYAKALNDSGQVVGYSSLADSPNLHATLWQEEAPGPVDSDGDGIEDSIDTGDASFSDELNGGTTAGTIGTIPTGYTVTVTDLDPDGVLISVAGSGTEKVTFTLTNPVTGNPCGTLKLGPGSEVEVTCGSITVHVVTGEAEIVLGDGSTVLHVPEGGTARVVENPDGTFTVENLGDVDVIVSVNGHEQVLPPEGSATVTAYVCDGPAPVGAIVGTNGPNVLLGTSGDDVIFGLGGFDLIDGRGGNDTICAGAGTDAVDGGAGDDWIDLGAGIDAATGGSGEDDLLGQAGTDVLFGGLGDDTLDGGTGFDRLDGEAGTDTCVGESLKRCEL